MPPAAAYGGALELVGESDEDSGGVGTYLRAPSAKHKPGNVLLHDWTLHLRSHFARPMIPSASPTIDDARHGGWQECSYIGVGPQLAAIAITVS
jgi:hypothetical protein